MIEVGRLDDSLFAPEEPTAPRRTGDPWKILIVDDDEAVHQATRLVLEGREWRDRPFEFASAYSAQEARQLHARDGYALILLDVVMETDDAGLIFTRWLRDEYGDKLARIILRTGQPGQAPEQRVIIDYEIDDYKTKTELTSTRLFTSVVAALRAYASLKALEQSRAGLQRVIDASANLMRIEVFENFAGAVLEQIAALIDSSVMRILFARGRAGDLMQIASIGFDAGHGTIPDETRNLIARAFDGRDSVARDNDIAIYIDSEHGGPYVLFVESSGPLASIDADLLKLFCHRIAAGFSTTNLYGKLKGFHRASIELISRIVEYKDDNTGEHVFRVASLSRAIADHLRQNGHYREIIDDAFIEAIGYAAIIHDVGKVAIPDAVLKKPARFDAGEWACMQAHSELGGVILRRTVERIEDAGYLGMGFDVARYHHEHWDGTGYPTGLTGEAIPLAARIVSVADVFDALTHERCYKKAWPIAEAIDYIQMASARDFDPRVVDAFLATVDLNEEAMRPYAVNF